MEGNTIDGNFRRTYRWVGEMRCRTGIRLFYDNESMRAIRVCIFCRLSCGSTVSVTMWKEIRWTDGNFRCVGIEARE